VWAAVGTTRGFIPRCWCTGATACGPRPGHGGFSTRSARSWSRPGVLRGRGRRVLDSTILEDAVATQDTVTQLVAAIRRVRRLIPQARAVAVDAHDYDRPGKPVCAWDDPQAKQALG
jgi:hypothetical protein